MSNIIQQYFPEISNEMREKMISFVQGDLRKLSHLVTIYQSNKELFIHYMKSDLFQMKTYNEDTKKIMQKLITHYYPFEQHNTIMNETDRTIVGLLWHENIIDALEKMDKKTSVPFYLQQLENMCFADYMDRITFQKQIWQFNEMTSLMKTLKNNKLYHSSFPNTAKNLSGGGGDIRFTKVLTKYSTEYNNSLFIQNLCLQLGMDKKDLFSFFMDLKNKYEDSQIIALFENYEINKLDVNRIYRYLDKYIKDNIKNIEEEIIEFEIEEEELLE
jgi:hypothetical protein